MSRFKWFGFTASGERHEGEGESGTDCVNQASALKVENVTYTEISEEASEVDTGKIQEESLEAERSESPVPGLSETQVLEIPAEFISQADALGWQRRARTLSDLIISQNTVFQASPGLPVGAVTTQVPIWGTLLNLARATIRND